jgi:hypothetical protein
MSADQHAVGTKAADYGLAPGGCCGEEPSLIGAGIASGAKIPYPKELFITRDDTLKAKAAIDAENARMIDAELTKQAQCGQWIPGAVEPLNIQLEHFRDLLLAKANGLEREKDAHRSVLSQIEQRQMRLYRLIDDLR